MKNNIIHKGYVTLFDTFHSIALQLSDLKFGVPILILGLLLDRRVFINALVLLLLSMTLNPLLKAIFQVPLNPELGKEGFAMPSGHMQACVSFYGYLFLAYTRPMFRVFIVLLLTIQGISMIYANYHTFAEVLAGAFVGIALIVGYSRAMTKHGFMPLTPYVLAICALSLIGQFLIYKIARHAIFSSSILLAIYILIATFPQFLLPYPLKKRG